MKLLMRRIEPKIPARLALILCSLLLGSTLYSQSPSPNELPLSEVVPSQGPSTATATAIASDGQAFVALWSNYVIGRDVETHSRGLNADGAAVGVSWQLQGFPLNPAIASNGVHDLAVWSIPLGGTRGIFLDRQGHPEGDPFIIHEPTATPPLPHLTSPASEVAWDGTDWVILSSLETFDPVPGGYMGHASLAVSRIHSGGIIDPRVVTIDQASGGAIAANAGVSVVVWADSAVHALVTTSSGNAPMASVSPAGSSPIIAAGPDGFLVIYADTSGIAGRHLNRSGIPDLVPFSIAAAPHSVPSSVVATSTGYAVAWQASDSVTSFVLRVASDGTPLDPQPLVLHGSQVSLADNGRVTVAEFITDGQPVTQSIFGTGAPQQIDWRVLDQDLVSSADCQGGTLAVWHEPGDVQPVGRTTGKLIVGGFDPLGKRIAQVPLDDSDFVAPQVVAAGDGTAAIAWTGTNGPLKFQKFDCYGKPLSTPLVVAAGASHLELIWAPAGFALFWNPANVGGTSAVILSKSGSLVSGPVVVDPQGFNFSVISNSSGRLLLVRNNRSFLAGLDALLLDDQLRLITQTPQIIGPRLLPANVDVATDGTDFFVVWRSKSQQLPANDYIGGRRVSHDGALLGGRSAPSDSDFIYTSGGDYKEEPHVKWNGSEYIIYWAAATNGDPIPFGQAAIRFYQIRVAQNGTLLDPPPYQPLFSITTNEYVAPQDWPWDVQLTSRGAVFSYSRRSADPQFGGASRAFLHFAGTRRRAAGK